MLGGVDDHAVGPAVFHLEEAGWHGRPLAHALGAQLVPTLIDRVQDRDGKTIFRADRRECPHCAESEWKHQPVPTIPDNREQIADPLATYQVVQMLEGVVQRGTGTAVKAVGKPIAGKTGTTNDWQDAWFVGFTPDLAAGVYVGYDEPVNLGSDETGGHLAAPIFRDFMLAALKDVPAKEFRTPPGIRMYRVNPATGLPAAGGEPAIWEGYRPGTEPGKDQRPHAPDAAIAAGPDGLPQRAAPASGTGGLY